MMHMCEPGCAIMLCRPQALPYEMGLVVLLWGSHAINGCSQPWLDERMFKSQALSLLWSALPPDCAGRSLEQAQSHWSRLVSVLLFRIIFKIFCNCCFWLARQWGCLCYPEPLIHLPSHSWWTPGLSIRSSVLRIWNWVILILIRLRTAVRGWDGIFCHVKVSWEKRERWSMSENEAG